MALQPNRPIRVGTRMMLTDAKGQVPDTGSKKAAAKVGNALVEPVISPPPSKKSKAKKP